MRNNYEAELGPLVSEVMSVTATKGHLCWLCLWEDNLVTVNVVTDNVVTDRVHLWVLTNCQA